MPSTLTSFTDNNPSSDVLFYQIEVVMNGSCVQTVRDNVFSGARSNIVYNGTPVTVEVYVDTCENYNWNGLVLTASGDYLQSFHSQLGYDSVVTLHLTIYEVETSEFTVTTTDTCYIWNNEQYCESGDYIQTFQSVHECDSVVTLHLTITSGIEDQDTSNPLVIYPNPTTGIVNIRLSPETCNLTPEIHLFDIYGRRLQMMTVTGETTQIDLSNYSTGIYIIKLVDGGRVVATGKVVKQ